MEKVVINATVLIFLAKIGKLEFLNVYDVIMTTSEVYTEVVDAKEISFHEKNILIKFFDNKIKIENPKKIKELMLGKGETSALSLCSEKNILIFLSDDKKARRQAGLLSLQVIGTIGIILENVKQKKVTKEQAEQTLFLLIQNSYYISTDVYAHVLALLHQ